MDSTKGDLEPKPPFPRKAAKSCTPPAFRGPTKTKGAGQGKAMLLPSCTHPWKGPLGRLSASTAAVFTDQEETTWCCTDCQARRRPLSSWAQQHGEDSHSGSFGGEVTCRHITPQMQIAHWPSDRREYKNLLVIDTGRYHP